MTFTIKWEPASNGDPLLRDTVVYQGDEEIQRFPNTVPPGREHLHPYEDWYKPTLLKEEL